jgi:hypothetical protein
MTSDPLERVKRIRREDALEGLDRPAVIQAFVQREPVFLGKRHGLWDWGRDGIPLWLVPELQDCGLLGG